MGSYILMVIVTADQEAAIEDLFQIKGWTYDKTGVVPLPREETLLGLNHNKLADCSPGDIQQTFHPSYHQSVSHISNSLLTVDTTSAKEIHERSLTAESQCQNIMVKCTSDSNPENSQVGQNRIQRLPTCNSVDINYSDVSRETSKQFEVNRDTKDPATLATVDKQDLHQPVNYTSHFTSQTAKSSADFYEDSLKVLVDQRNEAIGAAVSGKHRMEISMCNVNIEDKFQEVTMVKNGAPVENAKESVNDDSKSFLAQKERIDLNNGTNVLKMFSPSLEDRCIVNACFDNKLLNDFDMICKILKNAMQIEFDKKLILPKLEEILTSGRYLWNKSSEMGRVGQGKRELNKDCFLNEKDKSYGGREEKEVINDLDKQKEIEDNDTDLIEDKSPTTPMTFNTQEIEADSDFIGNSGTIVKDARKYKNVKIKSDQSESYSKSTKWIKCEILNCSGGIDKAFEENANDINHLDGVSSLTSKSMEIGKWKCNSNKQVLSSNEFQKVNDKSEKESSVKFRWTVNRNMRMHRFHRKCLTQPRDLDSDNYSEIEQGYFCRDCLFIFRRKNKYLLHKRLKGGHCLRDCIYCDADEQKEVYSCTKCPKCFQTKEMLERHNEKHNHLFGCDFCISEFYTVNDLKIHVQTVHAETALPTYLCDLCGSKFKERKVLNAHRRFVHSNHRPEACTSCDKRFKTKSQLKNHLVTHKQASELNLSCEICGKMFLRVATLKDHVRRHKKEFTCFCTICNKGFYRKYSLAEHMRVHTGDKPFDCKFCGFKCALSCNLVKHMKVHF